MSIRSIKDKSPSLRNAIMKLEFGLGLINVESKLVHLLKNSRIQYDFRSKCNKGEKSLYLVFGNISP
jgi:hypothetical protein